MSELERLSAQTAATKGSEVPSTEPKAEERGGG
jgi:hypothetical protein